eukprot:scaffold876_cov243-Pinguiococcus_pyrenoidosus.AAC.25
MNNAALCRKRANEAKCERSEVAKRQRQFWMKWLGRDSSPELLRGILFSRAATRPHVCRQSRSRPARFGAISRGLLPPTSVGGRAFSAASSRMELTATNVIIFGLAAVAVGFVLKLLSPIMVAFADEEWNASYVDSDEDEASKKPLKAKAQ